MLQVTACGAIAVILERMGQAARPLAASVMAVAPRIWVASEGQNLLRIHVVSVLCKAAAALGPESEGAAPLLLSIIAVTTDVDNPENVCGNASPTLTLEPQLRALFFSGRHLFWRMGSCFGSQCCATRRGRQLQ